MMALLWSVQQTLAETDAEVPRISREGAKGLLGRLDVLFLDVREPADHDNLGTNCPHRSA